MKASAMLKKELVDEMLLNAKSHANDGDILESKRLYQAALQAKKELIFHSIM